MPQIAKLESVELRSLWAHEEHGFSAWLLSNLDTLGECLGLTLQSGQREKAVGRFSLDVLAETDGGAQVIIENQLDCTDHDHLGKILTYLSNMDAKIAVWVAGNHREEHAEAIRWLNEFTPADMAFYLVKLSAFRIGNSDPAPHFAVVAGPSANSRSIGQEKKELAERHVLRRKFWEQLLDRARKAGVLTHAQRAPSTDSWLGAGAGIMAGVSFNYNIWTDSAAVDLWIQNEDVSENKKLFDKLFGMRQQIEAEFGGSLLWERLDDKRASRIRADIAGPGLHDPEDQWATTQERMVRAMNQLSKAIRIALRMG
jgi:hypothetical protein